MARAVEGAHAVGEGLGDPDASVPVHGDRRGLRQTSDRPQPLPVRLGVGRRGALLPGERSGGEQGEERGDHGDPC